MQRGDTVEDPPAHRQKTVKSLKACDECNRRKRKCDKTLPVCAYCATKYGRLEASSRCRYSPRINSKSESKSRYLHPDTPRYPLLLPHDEKHGFASTQTTPATSLNASDDGTEASYSPRVAGGSDFQSDDPVFSKASVNEGTRFLVDPSDQALLELLLNLAANDNANSSVPLDYEITQNNAPVQYTHSDQNDRLGTLPPRHLADFLFEVYWRTVHPLYPFLDRTQMYIDYSSFWNGQPTLIHDAYFLAMLNLIFALASASCVEIALYDRQQLATTFYNSALAVLSGDNQTSMASAQCFLLRALYMQSVEDFQQSWTLIDQAMQTAQASMGIAGNSQALNDYAQTQLFRRLWHATVLMDRLTAMVFGKLPHIPERAAAMVPTPNSLPSDSSDEAEDFSFFIESVKLSRIMYKSVTELYVDGSTLSQGSSVDGRSRQKLSLEGEHQRKVLSIHSELTAWYTQLPDFLSSTHESSMDSLVRRQAVVLQRRYLHTKVTILRPIFTAFVAAEAGINGDKSVEQATLNYHLARGSSLNCVKAAVQALTIAPNEHPQVDDADDRLVQDWHDILYIYTAASVVAAAISTPALCADLDVKVLQQKWNTARSILLTYKGTKANPRVLLASLNQLYNNLENSYDNAGQAVNGILELPTPVCSGGTPLSTFTNSRLSSTDAMLPPWPDASGQQQTLFQNHTMLADELAGLGLNQADAMIGALNANESPAQNQLSFSNF